MRVLVAILAVVALAACSSDTARPEAASSSSAPPRTPPVEAPIDPIPEPWPAGEHGDLVRYQRVNSPAFGASTGFRVLYHSQDTNGRGIPMTGLIVIPPGTPPPGGWPVVSWAHGTTGLADICTPSVTIDAPTALLSAYAASLGYLYVATDYEGLGTPGRHTYLTGASEGHAVLDMVRAARQLPQANAGDRVVVLGHSQGGQAALFANELAATYVPEVKLLGTIAGAPATELPMLTAAFRGSTELSAYVLLVAGWKAAYPDADLDLVLTDAAQQKLGVVDTTCGIDLGGAYAGMTYEEVIRADPAMTPPWDAIVLENDPGHVRSEPPLFIIHGTADTTVPVTASQLLTERLCSLGQVVQRNVYEGQSHTGVVFAAAADLITWIADRFAGKPAPSSCPTG